MLAASGTALCFARVNRRTLGSKPGKLCQQRSLTHTTRHVGLLHVCTACRKQRHSHCPACTALPAATQCQAAHPFVLHQFQHNSLLSDQPGAVAGGLQCQRSRLVLHAHFVEASEAAQHIGHAHAHHLQVQGTGLARARERRKRAGRTHSNRTWCRACLCQCCNRAHCVTCKAPHQGLTLPHILCINLVSTARPLTPVLWEHCPVRMLVREGQHSAKSVMYCVKLAPANRRAEA